MSLVETLVAIFLFSLGIIAVTVLFTRSWKANSYILEEATATTAATKALDVTVKDLRKVRQADNGSFPIKSVGNFDLVVYLDDEGDGTTEQVHYFLDNQGNFKKGVSRPSGTPAAYPSNDQTITTLAQHIVNTSSQPVFYYYDKNFPLNTSNNPIPNPQPGDVKLISVHLWVNIKPNTAPDNINLESFANLRNLNVND
ncbi:MAG TPA: hypothetical protein VF817_02705 [Patescibacteria group bacterium]